MALSFDVEKYRRPIRDHNPDILCLRLKIPFHIGESILFGNLNAAAMEPLGHIAGIGAAVVGSLSTLIAVPLGILVGQSYNETVLPMLGGFAVFSIISLFVSRWAAS